MAPSARFPSFRIAASLVLIVSLASACGSSSRIRYDSPKEAFDKGMEFYNRERYDLAIQYFQGAFDFGRAHEYAADAQLFLARAYRANYDYLLAANEYARFTQIYRSDPRVPDAEYELAMTYFDRSPDYQFDQTDTEKAIEQLQLFINRSGNSPRVADAQDRIAELREKLAHKQYNVAQMYERVKQYEAAALSYEAIFDDYYDTTLADDALLGAMRNYLEFGKLSVRAKQRERYQLVIDDYDRMIQIFTDSPLIKDAEAIYDEASQLLAGTQVDS